MDQAGYLQNLDSVIPGTDMTHRPLPDEPLNDEPFNVIEAVEMMHDTFAIPQETPELTDSQKLDSIMAQLTMIQTKQAKHDEAFQYLTGAMQWLTNMLGSVAQVAQNMPGMGGMMAKMMGLGGGKNNG